jgi:hypothetical protein
MVQTKVAMPFSGGESPQLDLDELRRRRLRALGVSSMADEEVIDLLESSDGSDDDKDAGKSFKRTKIAVVDLLGSSDDEKKDTAPLQVSLRDGSFRRAIMCYIDEKKPNPLARLQMEDWKMTWEDNHLSRPYEVDFRPLYGIESCLPPSRKMSFKPTHGISGTLTWRGKYVAVELQSNCYWKGDKEGYLFLEMSACSRFLTEAEVEERMSNAKEEREKDAKVRKRMEERLESDEDVQWLLYADPSQVCEMSLHIPDFGLIGERVDSNEHVLESIRRSVFSKADSRSDILNILLNLPLLPCKSFHGIATPHLVDRAKLRLLQDASERE